MNRIASLFLILLVGCSEPAPRPSEDVFLYFIGVASFRFDEVETIAPIIEIEDEAQRFVTTGGALEVGIFANGCTVHLADIEAGWQPVTDVCVVPETGEPFVIESGNAILSIGGYGVALTGTYQGKRAIYHSFVGRRVP